VRVSTDQQETDRQYSAIQAWSRQHDLPIDEWIEDTGRRHLADQREGFTGMMARVRAGQIGRVVVEQQDRLGFAGPAEWFKRIADFIEAEAKLTIALTNQELASEDIHTTIIGAIGADQSKGEQTTKGTRGLGKKLEMARRGAWTGGWIAYGTDVVCRTADGGERWRVVYVGYYKRLRVYPDGRAEEWNGKGKGAFPRDRQPGDILVLAHSIRTERMDALRFMFAAYDQGEPYCRIARRLNERPEWTHPHGPWYPMLVKHVLQNPVAIGKPAFNKLARGEFSEVSPDGQVKVGAPKRKKEQRVSKIGKPVKSGLCRRRPPSEWVFPPTPIFRPIVDEGLFWRVQNTISAPKGACRGPRSDVLTYSGLVYCGHCGQKMVGWTAGKRETGEKHGYVCSSYRRLGAANATGCRLHRIRQSAVDRAVDEYLARTGQTVVGLVGHGEEGLVSAILHQLGQRRAELKTVWAQMEHYLQTTLHEIADPTPLADGRTRFELEGPEGRLVIDLPGCESSSDLEQVYAAVAASRRSVARRKVSELEGRQRALYQRWCKLEGNESAQALVQEEMDEVNRLIKQFKSDEVALESQVRELCAILIAQHLELNKARRANPRLKARLVAGLIDRVVCYFDHHERGSQRCSSLARTEVWPLVGDRLVSEHRLKTKSKSRINRHHVPEYAARPHSVPACVRLFAKSLSFVREKPVQFAFVDAHLVSYVPHFDSGSRATTAQSWAQSWRDARGLIANLFNSQESATMRAMLRGVVGLGLVALLAGPAFAQVGGRGFGMMGGGGIGMLIGNESVQKELKLDDAQVTKAKELADKNGEKMRTFREETKDLDQEERATKRRELAKEMNESTLKAVAEFLKPEQVARLKQCSYQAMGAMAFSDPEIAKKLNITDAQKGEIKSITDDANAAAREIFQGFQDDREGAMKKLAEHRKETLSKVVAKLNDEQQKSWKELIGAPFELKMNPPRGN
jgi:hypothetical protein